MDVKYDALLRKKDVANAQAQTSEEQCRHMASDVGFIMFPRWLNAVLRGAPPARARLLIQVLTQANLKTGEFMGRVILPGQLVFSVANLARECRISVAQTRSALVSMQAANLISIESTNKFSILTVLNWSTYSGSLGGQSQTESLAESQIAQQSSRKQDHNNQKNKEPRSKSRGAKFSPPSPAEVTAYAASIGFNLDGQEFCDKNESIGWVVGKNRAPMKDWRAVVCTWHRKQKRWDSENSVPLRHPDSSPQYVRVTEWVQDPNEPMMSLGPNGEIIETPRTREATNELN